MYTQSGPIAEMATPESGGNRQGRSAGAGKSEGVRLQQLVVLPLMTSRPQQRVAVPCTRFDCSTPVDPPKRVSGPVTDPRGRGRAGTVATQLRVHVVHYHQTISLSLSL